MKYKSLFISLENKACYVIGGNKSAVHISESLLEDGALVTVWSENFVAEFTDLAKKYPKQLNLLQAEFSLTVAQHYCSAKVKPFVVVTTLADAAANQKICDICKKNNVLSANPGSNKSEVIFVNNQTAEPVELAILTKGMPDLSRKLQNYIGKYIIDNWLDAVRSYNSFIQNESIMDLGKAEYRIYVKRLAEEIIKSEGDFDSALKQTQSYFENLKEKDLLLFEIADQKSLMD